METEALLSKADLIVTGGKVVTLDPAGTIAEAIAIKGERILAVGRTQAIAEFVSPQTQQINAAGRLVVPGLIDGHAHMDREGLKDTLPS
ncbi:MAG TPA: amidohydrolase, partial [Gammaproteobacteria bacterium]|nr:amidohydrolase [Gammaproteobacteria bacterium]